jgi:hypothetical protein
MIGAARRALGSLLVSVGVRLLWREVGQELEAMQRPAPPTPEVVRVQGGVVGFTREAEAMIAAGRVPAPPRPEEEPEEVLAGSLRAQARR